jgi:hypothetical protein
MDGQLTTVSATPVDTGRREPHLNGLALSCLDGLLTVVDFLFSSAMKNVSSYRLTLKKFKAAYGRRAQQAEYTHRLCFWCLNPAVAFAPVVRIDSTCKISQPVRLTLRYAFHRKLQAIVLYLPLVHCRHWILLHQR